MTTRTATVPRETTNGHKPVAEGELAPTQLIIGIPVDLIDVGTNVRVNVAGLDELAASIKEHGLKQPIKVRADGARWLVVYGQRRLLAHRVAGIERIPSIVADEEYTAGSLAIEQLVENLHREDLPPLDRARAMRVVVDAGTSQADLARELGLHPSTIANDLGLLEAPAAIQEAVERGELTPSHAKALKGLAAKTQLDVANDAIRNGYSAHRLEEEVQRAKRNADAQRERDAQQIKERKAHKVELAASIAAFEKKKVPKDARIVVDSGYYGQGNAAAGNIAKLIEGGGYTNVSVGKQYGEVRSRPTGGVCDCEVWKAAEFERGSYDDKNRYVRHVGISIVKGCVNRKHEQAKLANDEAARRAKEATGTKVQQHVRQAALGVVVPATSADTPLLIGIPRILAEAILWDVLSYRLPEWSIAHGGKREKPWTTVHGLSDEQLAKELASAVASDFRDKAGYHVDWPALAVELGLVEPEPAQPAKAKRQPKAAPA